MIFLLALISSIICTLIVIRFSKIYAHTADSQLSGPQKFHAVPVPRVGGLAVFISLCLTLWYAYLQNRPDYLQASWLLLTSLPAFCIGLIEDITKKVSPTIRLLACAAAALLACFVLNAVITHVGIPWVDRLLGFYAIAVIFTVFAVAGLCNAINIIDGFNGLAGFVSTMMFLSMAYVAYQVNDPLVMLISLAMAAAIAGFLIWNYPLGLIFLGDGGAYFIGFMLAENAILLVTRNAAVSPWYAVLLLSYPIVETAFSIYRKKFVRGMSPSIPDGVHLHMLVFRRMIRWAIGSKSAAHMTIKNSSTSPYLWFLCGMAVIPATLLWQNTWILIGFCLLFCVTYVWIYSRIVRFKTPKWMIYRK